MPYCHKCGAQLKEDDKYCQTCGAAVGRAPALASQRRTRPLPAIPVLALVALLIAATIIAALLFFPINPVRLSRSETVPYQTGVTALDLNLTADIAIINVRFASMPDKLVALDVSATGGTTILAPPNPLNVTFDHSIAHHTLTVASTVRRTTSWTMPYGLNVICNLTVNPSMKINMYAKTSVGRILLQAGDNVVFESLTLKATTGQIEATLHGTTIQGQVALYTTTGGISLSLRNTTAPNNAAINVETTTGGIDLNIQQDTPLPANVTLTARATTGGISFGMAIRDDVAARIASETKFGGISFTETGFNGTKTLLLSDNYPNTSNFDASLETTTGGVQIAATYTP